MDQLIYLLVVMAFFAAIAWGLFTVCVKFGMPQPILWICGAILLVILLVFAANLAGVGGGSWLHGPLLRT